MLVSRLPPRAPADADPVRSTPASADVDRRDPRPARRRRSRQPRSATGSRGATGGSAGGVEARYVGQSWTLAVDLRARRPERDRPRGARARSTSSTAAPTATPCERADRAGQLHGRRRRRNRGRALRESEPDLSPGARPDDSRHGSPGPVGAGGKPSAPASRVTGPAVIDERGSTTVVEPGYVATARPDGMLILAPRDRASTRATAPSRNRARKSTRAPT